MNTILRAKCLATSLINRMAWETQCKPLLQLNEIKTGLGSEWAIGKLSKAFDDSETYAENFIDIYGPYYEHLLPAGDRTITIYQLDEDEFTNVFDAYTLVQESNDVSTEYFPYLVPHNELELLSEQPVLMSVQQQDDKAYFYFSSNRCITEKRNIDLKTMPQDDKSVIEKYLKHCSKLTGFSSIPRQYIDVVCLNKKDCTIEIRLDTGPTVSKKDIDKLFREVKEAFVELLDTRLDTIIFKKQLNFFPLIEQLYKNEQCRVVELSFTTSDGYVHNERDRNSTKGGDVRTGEFHQGGIKACSIDPYRISVRWEECFSQEIDYEYELSLNSSVKEQSEPESNLEQAIITMCPTATDFEKILTVLKENHELSETA